MKRVFTFLIWLISFSAFSQVSTEKVLIEMGTATWNNACASEVAILEELKDQGLDIAFINYHLNDPFANIYSNSRASYYNIQSVPYPVVQGEHIANGELQNYLDAYEEAISQNSSFVISASGSFLGDTLFVEVSVQKVADYESDKIKLQVALVESNIAYEWLQNNEVDDVERSMAPDAEGSTLDFSSFDTQNINLEILMDEDWNPAEMDLVTFVQNDTSHQVLQCHSLSLTEFAPLPVHAFFQVDDTLICRKDMVSFENFSTGDVESYEWHFEGGTPETSTEINPIVKYNEAGVFDVQLIVSNSISLDTSLKLDYMEVQELPAISFDPLPDFCDDDPPYLLTEGWPEEGNYFGLFVDTGYFHPMTAGSGEYTVYFAYQDEESLCSDTLSQLAIVDLCNTVNETTESENIRWFWSNNKLHLQQKFSSSVSSAQILIYNLQGQEIKNTRFSDRNEIVMDIPPQLQCFVLVLKSGKDIKTTKICR